MKRKTLLKVLAIAMFSIMLVGCGSSDNNEESNSGGIDKEQYYNTYLGADPTSFDSAQASDSYAISILNNVMEPLTRLEEKEDQSTFIAPAGAAEWEVSDDGLVYTFKLRDNKWSDGEKVTADDYVYGISKVIDPNEGSPLSYLLLPIKNAYSINNGEMAIEELGVKAIDEKTVEITLEEPTSYFIQLTYLNVMFPQRRDVVKEHGDKYGTEVQYAVYNGPFKVEKWTHNNEVILTKNQEYWDKDNVKLETINFKIIQDENAIYNSLENGSIDSATASTKQWVDTFKSNKDLTNQEMVNPQIYYQYYNQSDELFSNANVRKAFTLAVDREELNNAIYDGMYEGAYGFIPNAINVGDTEFRSVAANPIKKLQEENKDPKALLIKGLKELGMDTDPSKVTVTLSLGGTDQWNKTLAEYLQQTYKKVLGVNLEIDMLEWGVFINNFYNYDYQMAQMSWTSEFNDPLCMFSCLDSSQDGFMIGWGDERVDEILKAAMGEEDEAKKIKMIEEIEDIFMYRDGCVSPLTFSKSNYFMYNYVKGMPVTPFATSGYKYVYTEGREK